MTIRVGIIGASFARDAYLPAFRHVEGAEVVALASHRLASARAAAEPYGIARVYDDWEAMIEENEPDLVCIATPTDTHAPMTIKALDHGAHVLCEKPTAMNATEARTMLDTARAKGRLHMIDHELRFNPNRMKIAEIVASGALGDIRHAHIVNIGASWNEPASRPKGDWWSDAAQGGGRLGANGSHQVDLLRWWLGEPTAVVGQALTMVPDRLDKKTSTAWTATADDLAWFMLEMPGGALAEVFMSGVVAVNLGAQALILGSKGALKLSNDDERLYISEGGSNWREITVPDPNAGLSGLNKGIWNVSVVAALRELTSAIAERRPLKRGATFVDGLRNQLVLDAVRTSTTSRRWEKLDLTAAG